MVRWSCAAMVGVAALIGCHGGPATYSAGNVAGTTSHTSGPDCAPGASGGSAACGHNECGHEDCGPHCCLTSSHYHSFWDRLITSMSAQHRAGRAFGEYVAACGQQPSHDFHTGFVDGYVDVAQGGSGMVPPIPPEQYWGAPARTPTGHQRAQEWFAGYATGAQSALSSSCAAYNRVPHRHVGPPAYGPAAGPPLPVY
ncbi:hypothetical protein [Maioricimonas sp. JC845]|uniref:hypothetical protein n=1 Tax=Maioricimonas sp. JC845 TaxID=3232138 RepID=UPI00345A3C7A